MTSSMAHLALVLAHKSTVLYTLIKDINFRLREIPCRDPLLKEKIQLSECPACWFWDAEIRVEDAKEAEAGPEEAGEETPIPFSRIQHVGRKD